MPEDTLEVVAPEATEPEAAPEAEVPEETIEDVKAKLAKAEELVGNYKVRAEKAETKLKTTPPAPTDPQLSTKDVLFLAKTDIHADDLDEVLDWAKFKKIDVSEAYVQMKPTLEVKAEHRKSAEASNIAPSRRSNAQVSDEVLIANANAGKLPDSDADIERLVAAKARSQRS